MVSSLCGRGAGADATPCPQAEVQRTCMGNAWQVLREVLSHERWVPDYTLTTEGNAFNHNIGLSLHPDEAPETSQCLSHGGGKGTRRLRTPGSVAQSGSSSARCGVWPPAMWGPASACCHLRGCPRAGGRWWFEKVENYRALGSQRRAEGCSRTEEESSTLAGTPSPHFCLWPLQWNLQAKWFALWT